MAEGDLLMLNNPDTDKVESNIKELKKKLRKQEKQEKKGRKAKKKKKKKKDALILDG